ncbi:tRNA 2-selenouridine(34) synthase MnmH [Sporosarcina sp. OR05]|uniref:tRNA 2-selenouridine(34) synthase MnmH n=1 Tax=Sporosarcina sp. OR05 TaxID=2969819 RepID=UPI00352B7358
MNIVFQDKTVAELLSLQNNKANTIVDVRSPSEFNEATIPGSVNIPIFSDEERAEIGTLYKKVSKEAAIERGLELFSAKLPTFIAQCKQIGTPLTVFCWRGGMRSKTAATVLDLMGVEVKRLSGGVRSYRQWVVNELEKGVFPPDLIVLNGYTGSGKTILLHRLVKEGFPILDLEQFAGHRGSIFGQIGLTPHNQKKFDSLLVYEMQKHFNEPFVFIEGESRRIGKVCVPSFLLDKKEKGVHVFIHLPIEERVRLLLDIYKPWQSPADFNEAFQRIKRRIHVPIAKEIEEALQTNQFDRAVQLLLQHYYDPRYAYSTTRQPQENNHMILAVSIEDAFEQLLALTESLKQARHVNS